MTAADPQGARENARLGAIDLHLYGEGRHERLWEALGAHLGARDGVSGCWFSVWAPNAQGVSVVGNWNGWDRAASPLSHLGPSGVWEGFVPGVGAWALYKFAVTGPSGAVVEKQDPLARSVELPPRTASVVTPPSTHEWRDAAWLARRADLPFDRQLSAYEVHLPSWRRHPDGTSLSYRELAEHLVDHVADLGFTHVEFMPVAEHPFYASWGYQVTGFYAPTSRLGTPDDLRFLIDAFHDRGIGVILDWVPAHFPKDDWSLARFDGTALYEHADPRRGEHPDWGTLVFNHGRHEVRNYLVANALYWLEEFHADGLRVDAVASMLYRDYSRKEGEWIPNQYGGREDLETISFLQEANATAHRLHPGILTIAEESTAWDGVTRATDLGGLGFTHKWNMGWMHDTLLYFSKDPVHRRWEHEQLTFGLLYAWSENYVLPLSHDEVVHGKRSLLGRMPGGDDWQRHANLRTLYGWMWAHPGKQLLFMGCELAQGGEWDHDGQLDWWRLDGGPGVGVRDLVRELNRVQAALPALSSADHDPSRFRWLEADDRENSVYAFVRFAPVGSTEADVVCVANLTPVPRLGYRVGLPGPGEWEVVLDTDEARWGGSGAGVAPGAHGAGARRVAEPTPWHGCEQSTVLDLPPLSVVWLAALNP